MKKLLLGLGTTIAIVTPVTTVIACGSNPNNQDNQAKTEIQLPNGETGFKFPNGEIEVRNSNGDITIYPKGYVFPTNDKEQTATDSKDQTTDKKQTEVIQEGNKPDETTVVKPRPVVEQPKEVEHEYPELTNEIYEILTESYSSFTSAALVFLLKMGHQYFYKYRNRESTYYHMSYDGLGGYYKYTLSIRLDGERVSFDYHELFDFARDYYKSEYPNFPKMSTLNYLNEN